MCPENWNRRTAEANPIEYKSNMGHSLLDKVVRLQQLRGGPLEHKGFQAHGRNNELLIGTKVFTGIPKAQGI